MTKRACATFVGTVVGLGASATLAPVKAQSATERSAGRATYSEYKRAKTGMTIKQVAKLFGTKGKQASKSSGFGITVETRSYPGCREFSAVSVVFTNGTLNTKSRAGL